MTRNDAAAIRFLGRSRSNTLNFSAEHPKSGFYAENFAGVITPAGELPRNFWE